MAARSSVLAGSETTTLPSFLASSMVLSHSLCQACLAVCALTTKGIVKTVQSVTRVKSFKRKFCIGPYGSPLAVGARHALPLPVDPLTTCFRQHPSVLTQKFIE